jgi:hypothetical protein
MKEFAKLENGSWVIGNFSWLPVDDEYYMTSNGYFQFERLPITGAPNTEVIIERVGNKCYEKELTTVYKASINDLSKEISGVMLDFFNAKWQHIRTVSREGDTVTVMFTLQESHRREWQRMVWEKWQAYVQSYVETTSANDETNELSGVKFSDLVMASYFGADWPLQPITANAPLSGTALSLFIAETKERLKTAYAAVRGRCIVTTVVQEECELALYHTANFIMLDVIPPPMPAE